MSLTRTLVIFVASLFVVSSTVAPSSGQADGATTETGTVAAVEGALTVQRAGSTASLPLGAGLVAGDRLRTGPGDRAKLVFLDESVITMAPSTEIVLQTQSFEPVSDRYASTIQLVNGKIGVALGDKYRQGDNRYEIETPTAVVLRGTEYIVLFNPASQASEVISVSGHVDVLGRLAVVGATVQVAPGSRTQINRGKYPSSAAAVSPDRMQLYTQGLDIVGTGRRDGLNVLHPVLNGNLAAVQDVPGASPRAAVTAGGKLIIGHPGETLGEVLSDDVRTNTQPILEYRRLQPGLPLPGPGGGGGNGGVHVEF
ncbi:MAG TPA: FecR domain-containing protein [Terriglobales bacterium]|nr:FecR domain-containing protein [Terriglobales bacterium]